MGKLTFNAIKVAAIVASTESLFNKRTKFAAVLEEAQGSSKIAIKDMETDLAVYQQANIDFANETIGEDWFVEPSLADIKEGLLGCWVIVRTYSAGVHFGKVLAYDQYQNVVIGNARRMHLFENLLYTDSISSSAEHGILHTSKLNDEEKAIQLNFVELNLCSKEAAATFVNFKTQQYT